MSGDALLVAAGGRAAAEARQRVDRALAAPRRRHRRVCLGIGVVLLGVGIARVLLGDMHISPGEFVRVLQGEQIPAVSFILTEITLPRTVLGVITGLAFGVAGATFQTVLRNPLASPDIIGVSMGASAFAVFGIIVLGLQGLPLSLCAVAGALLVAVITRSVAGTVTGMRIVLVGVGLAAGLSSVIQYLFTRADVWDVQVVLRWLTGGLSAANWPTITWAAPVIAALFLALAWCTRDLEVSELGPHTAVGLGMAPRRPELVLAAAVLLTAVAVAAVGPMAFVAFISGPLARGLNGGRRSLSAAGLIGATVVVAADYIGDYLLVDINFPAGVVTGAAGAIFLLWLMSRGRLGRKSL
jgi:iron complex transport system permease protein